MPVRASDLLTTGPIGVNCGDEKGDDTVIGANHIWEREENTTSQAEKTAIH